MQHLAEPLVAADREVDVVALRPLFVQTLELLEREANPLAQRRPAQGFGRRL